MLPDPTLQVKALDGIMAEVLRQDPQANFRVQTFRLQNEVDIRPTENVVDHLYDMLLAEADGMLYNKAQSLNMGSEEKPAIKAVQGGLGSNSGYGACHAWGTAGGCRYGKRCRFVHEELEDKSSRCWHCSSTQHLKSACPHRSEADPPRSAAGGSAEEAGKSKGKGKAKGGGKNGGKSTTYATAADATAAGEKGEGKGKNAGGTRESGTSDEKEKSGQPSAKKLETENTSPGETGSTEALMTEVTTLLKALSVASGPSIKACHLRIITEQKDGSVLLDGGATHCLKTASTKEWERANPIQVQLASGMVELRQCPKTGFVLSRDPVQTIIPMSRMAEAGYSLVWNQQRCSTRNMESCH